MQLGYWAYKADIGLRVWGAQVRNMSDQKQSNDFSNQVTRDRYKNL